MKKIIDSILGEAAAAAEEMKAAAEYDGKKVIAEAQRKCREIEADGKLLCENEINKLRKRCSSARASRRRIRLLEVKQDILTHAVGDAYRKITNVSKEEYENILLGLIEKRLHEGSCTIYFPKDKKPSGKLRDQIKNIAKKVSCEYSYSYDRGDINDGFILAYGAIEENCSFKALFEEKKGEIFDYAAQVLFEEG